MNPLIELQNVSKQFGQSFALRDVSLQLKPSRNLVLVGPSGAGKSTLLRLAAGLESPDSGNVLLHPDVKRSQQGVRSIAMLSQDYALYPQQSVQQNLHTALRNLKLRKSEVQERIAEVLNWFGIATLIDRLPSELSGGEAQRAAFAKALVTRPKLLLLDEPLSQVDTGRKEALLDLIKTSIANFKLTSLIVTHDPVEALRLGDDIAVLNQGKLVQHGPAQEVYRQPRNRVVGDLLSPFGMNWLTEEQAGLVAPKLVEKLGKGIFGVRPEAIRVESADKVSESGIELTDIEVKRVDELGFASLLHTSLNRVPLKILARGYQRVTPGLKLRCSIEPADVCCVPHDATTTNPT